MPVEDLFPSTLAPITIRDSQAIMPVFLRGTFTSDDTDTHDFVGDGRGKGRLSVSLHTTGTSTYSITVYGMHQSTATVGADGVFAITTFTVASTGADSSSLALSTITDPFPFYLASIIKSDTAETTNPTISVYMNFSAF